MELFKTYPALVTIWAGVEVVCFAGAIIGWGSLVFILKDEGFYLDVCPQLVIESNASFLSTTPIYPNDNSSKTVLPVTSGIETDVTSAMNGTTARSLVVVNSVVKGDGCPEQESRLNLWFAIAVCFMYLSFTCVSYVIRRLGTRIARLIFITEFTTGLLCLAFATPELPWILLPGLCFIGSAGLSILVTNLQVADLHPHIRSTIYAIFSGLFEFSSINKQLVKVAYENGIPRRNSYLFIAVLFVAMVTFSTLVLLPRHSISEELVEELKSRRRSKRGSDLKLKTSNGKSPLEKEAYINTFDKGENGIQVTKTETDDHHPLPKRPKQTLCQTFLTVTCFLHLYWTFVHGLRFVTFIGLLNVWLQDLFDDNEARVSYFLGVYAYMTMGCIVSSLCCGFLYDWLRSRYIDSGPIKSAYMPVVLPMTLVIVFSALTTVVCNIRWEEAPYIAFILFTFFRVGFFTISTAFIGEAFPLDHFIVLMGFLYIMIGSGALMQYPIFEWYEAYDGSATHVNILLLTLQLSSLVHPALLWIKARRDKLSVKDDNLYRQEITVENSSML